MSGFFIVVLAAFLWHTRRDLAATKEEIRALGRKLESMKLTLRRLGGEAPTASPTDATVASGAPLEPPPTPKTPVAPVRIAPSAHVAVTPAPAARRPRPAPAKERAPIEWERWLGVRGAALAGGAVMVLAFLYFVRVSLERGWITPEMRFVLGTLTGVGALVGSQFLHQRKLTEVANALAGAGAAGLYAVFWAGLKRWDLLSFPVAFSLMFGVTVVCGLTSVRRGSLAVAVLGLLGGFATPVVLSSGTDRPIALFGYVAFLNLGLVAVSMKRRWPMLGLLAVGATAVMEIMWLGARFTPERLGLALGIFSGLAGIFSISSLVIPEEDRQRWLPTHAAALMAPLLFAIYFATRVDLDPALWPLGLYLALLGGAASWVGQRHDFPPLGIGIAGGTVAVIAIWSAQHLGTATLTGAAAVMAGLAVLHHLPLERGERPKLETAAPAMVLSLGLMAVLTGHALERFAGAPAFPVLAALLAALVFRQGQRIGDARLDGVATLGLAALIGSRFLGHGVRHVNALEVGLLLLTAVAPQLLVLASRARSRSHRFAEIGAYGSALGLMLAFLVGALKVGTYGYGPERVLLPVLAFAVLALLASLRTGRGIWVLVAALFTAFAGTVWQLDRFQPDMAVRASLQYTLALGLFTATPFLMRGALLSNQFARAASALAPALWFPALYLAVTRGFGDDAIALLPLTLGAVGVAAATVARGQTLDPDTRRSVLVWHLATALGFVSIAIPLQLDREWITIGWALEAAALIELYRRLRHPGLESMAAFFVTVVGVRLCVNPAVLGYHDAGGTPVFNWLLYSYGVPAAAMFAVATRLRGIEASRQLVAGLAGFMGVAVLFVWINLTIAHAYQSGATLSLDFSRYSPAHNLTASIAWAAYALLLLGVGMARKIVPLRWISLAVLLLALSKVFLFDMRHLGDLYRVASLAGLAISLLTVSLAYQRFVFQEDS